jgi:hypothetical protein
LSHPFVLANGVLHLVLNDAQEPVLESAIATILKPVTTLEGRQLCILDHIRNRDTTAEADRQAPFGDPLGGGNVPTHEFAEGLVVTLRSAPDEFAIRQLR